MIKKLLVLMAASALIAIACFTVLGLMGGFNAMHQFAWWGPRYGDDWGRRGGPEITRDLPYAGGPRIDIGFPAEITYTQGDQPKFTITGPQSILDQLRLEDGDLVGPDGRDGPRFGWGHHYRGRLRIEIVSPNLHEFHLSGAQKLTVRNYDQDELRIHASGAADVEGQGKARRLEVDISGAGHVDLEQLPVDDARLSISGAGDANLDARRSSDVSLSGAGHVEFKCRPVSTSDHRSGFGSIDYGPACGSEPPPESSAPPAAPPAPAAPAPKTKV